MSTMGDPSFYSSCLICTKLCVHSKARLELNDCNSPTPTISRSTSVTRERNLKQQASSFAKCVSKVCELFNSPVPGDNSFQKDFNEFFKFTTLSTNCPVCEDCQQRIRLMSKVMIQIESLQAQLIELKKSVVKDLSAEISAENGFKHNILNNKMKFFINCGVKTRLFREKLKEKLQTSSAGSNAVGINDVVDSTVIPEINSYLLNNEKFFIECGRKTKLSRKRLQEKLQIASTRANAVHKNDDMDSTMISEINRRNTDAILNHGVADTKTPCQLNEDCLTLLCDDFVINPRPPSNGENEKDSVDDSIDIPICGVSSDDEDEEIHTMEVTKGKKKLGRRCRSPRRIHWRQLKVNDVCFRNTEEEAQGTVTVVKTKPESLKKRDDDDDYLPESESSSEDKPEESTGGSRDDSDNDCSSHSTELQVVNLNGVRNLDDTVDAVDEVDSAVINEIAISNPHTDAVLFGEERTDLKAEENEDGFNLHCDDDYFDMKPDPDYKDDLNNSIDDSFSCCDEVQSKPTKDDKNKLDVNPENKNRYRTNSHMYASIEVEGTTCALTLSHLKQPVVIDNSLKISLDGDKTDIAFALNNNRPRSRSKSQKICKQGNSISDKRKMLKCTFVDPVKGKCRAKALDQDRLNAHVNRSHKNIPESITYECSICPFATGTIKRLNRHQKQHATDKDVSCETTTSILDINCHYQIQQPLKQQNNKITSEIEYDFDAGNQNSDKADVNLIAGIKNPKTEDSAHTAALAQLGEPTNADNDLQELQKGVKVPVSDSETNSKSTSQAKSSSDAPVRVKNSDSNVRKGQRPTKLKLKRDKPVKKHMIRDARKLLQCTHVDPVKGMCGFKLLDQDRLEAHINRYHKKIPNSKSFTCKLCPFATRTMQYLTLHNKIHAGIKDATCEVCGVSFRRESSLLQHKRRKHGEPFPVYCNICEMGFNNSYMLKLHNYQNHVKGEDYTHRCSVCDEGFYSKIHLKRHMVKHAERTFKCDQCPKAYQTSHGLQRHTQTIHTGDRPFACDQCDWKFFTQYRLDDHRSVHTNKRPFLCQECGFSSRLPGLLRAHLKVHANNHTLAEQGIEKAPRLAKPRNRRPKIFENTVLPLLRTETEVSTYFPVENTAQPVESEVAME